MTVTSVARRACRAWATGLTVVLLLAACSDDPAGDAAAPSPTATAPPAATAQPSAAPEPSVAPASSDAIPVDVTASHPAGVTVTATEVLVVEEGVQVTVRADNAAADHIVLATQSSWTYAMDDGGNRLALVPPAGNEKIRVDEGDELHGQLAFAGELAPDAESIDVYFNYQNGTAWNPDGGPNIVSLVLEGVPVTGEGVVATPARRTGEVGVDARAEFDGVAVEVSRVRTTPDGGIFLQVRATVDADAGDTTLASRFADTYLRDDTGVVHRLRPPEDNPELALAEGEELSGELAFVGSLAPAATSLQLFINADVDTDELQFTRPSPLDGPVSMVVEDLPVPRAED